VVDLVRLSATTTSNVVTYPVVVRVDNSDGTLLPGLTVNAEIEVSNKPNVLKVGNATLRFKPDENSELAKLAAASGPGGGGPGGGPGAAGGRNGGMLDDLSRTAAELALTPAQQAAFDDALAQMRERTMARQAQPQGQGQGGSALFGRGGGGPGGPRMVVMGGGGDANLQAQMRQRMRERFNQQFGGFRGSLSEEQRGRWDAAVGGLLGARRSQLYKLVDGTPQLVTVRLGASDGSSTEVAGDIREGDTVIVGERAQTP
jgi:HlyD family secretion protein